MQIELQSKADLKDNKYLLRRFNMIIENYSKRFKDFDIKIKEYEQSFNTQLKEIKTKFFQEKEKLRKKINFENNKT